MTLDLNTIIYLVMCVLFVVGFIWLFLVELEADSKEGRKAQIALWRAELRHELESEFAPLDPNDSHNGLGGSRDAAAARGARRPSSAQRPAERVKRNG